MKVIVVVALLLCGLYFYSDPFRANVDEAVEQNTTWTDERIIDNPELFVSDSLRKLDDLEESLEAQLLGLNTRRVELDRKQAADLSNVARLDSELKDWIVAYKNSEGEDRILIEGEPFTPAQIKSLILQADERLTTINRRLEYYPSIKLSVRGKITEVEDAIVLAQTERRRILDIRDRIELQVDRDSIMEIVSTIEALSDTSIALSSQVAPNEVTLDDVLAVGGNTESDDRFEEIMSRAGH